MSRLIAIVGLTMTAVAIPARADDPAADDAKQLQGEWQAVESHAEGIVRGKNDPAVAGLRFVFKGNELIVPHPKPKGEPRRKTYKLDSAKSPKEIDLTSHDGVESGQTTAAIYKLEQDRLTVCMPYFGNDPSARPNEFRATTDDGRMLVILERVKP
jgi:uncharacterized protein (TIGR03067 family)